MREDPFPGEDLIIISSPKVKTYDLEPQMSATAISETVNERLFERMYDVIFINFANPDMVGHTGNFAATKDACQVVDGCLGQLVDKCLQVDGALIITADHGKAEAMISSETKQSITEHSANPVPFIVVSKIIANNKNLSEGVLADVARTMLKMLKIAKPKEMTGRSLI